jgi:hypothetical protein
MIKIQIPITHQTRWMDAKGREWRIIEMFPFGRNLCTTIDLHYQGDWPTKEIRAAISGPRVDAQRPGLTRRA